MNGGTINGKTFKLLEKRSATKIAATVSYNADTATLVPTNPLWRGVTYKAIVTTGATDVAGNSLDQSPTSGSQQ
jgi:hypothetical protein